MALKLDVEGLDKLNELLKVEKIKFKFIKSISGSIAKVDRVLTNEVRKEFAFPKPLSAFRDIPVENINSNSWAGALNQLTFGFLYKAKTQELIDFTWKSSEVEPKSEVWFPVPNRFMEQEFNRGWMNRESRLEKISLRVSGNKWVDIAWGFVGQSPKDGNYHIYQRPNNAPTWTTLPSESDLDGERGKLKIMYGPNIVRVAEEVFEKSPKVQAVFAELEKKIADILL